MAKKRKKPEIRFKGFTDAWEQRKLGNIVDVISGKDYKHLSEGDIPVYGTGGYMLSVNEALSYKEDAIGIGRKGTIDKPYILRAPFWTVDTLFYAVPNTNNDLDFVLNIFQNINWKQKDESTGVPSLSKTLINETDILTPEYKEQKVIGAFFQNVYNIITLHQREYDKLSIIKKSMLEKMFPKDGSNVPEIRFNGFTDPWEQRKLSEIANKVNEKNVNFAVNETFTNSAEYGVISQRDFFDHDIFNLENIGGYYIVGEDDFVYNPRISATAPVGPINRNKLGRKGVMSPLYTVLKTHDIDSTFLEYFFKGNGWHSYMFFYGDTGARFDRFSIKNEVFFDMPISYPKIEEQRLIGRCLENLDNLITLHQRRLEKLRNIKSSCMEKMFV